MGGGEFDCLHKKVQRQKGYYFPDIRQTREGEKGKDGKIHGKTSILSLGGNTKNNYDSLFYSFLYFQNVWDIMYFYKQFYKALLEE